MKKILLVGALVLAGCQSPVTDCCEDVSGNIANEYRFEYEFKNDRRDDVLFYFSRDYEIISTTADSKGTGYNLTDSSLIDSVYIASGEIVSIWSNNDSLIVSPKYLLDKVSDRYRAIEYGHGMKWLSDDVYE